MWVRLLRFLLLLLVFLMGHLHPTSHPASRSGHLICPVCESGELLARGSNPLARCDSCDYAFDAAILGTLGEIVTLPDALGNHACECGHPEMRRLPDGAFHCPACGLEVLPIENG